MPGPAGLSGGNPYVQGPPPGTAAMGGSGLRPGTGARQALGSRQGTAQPKNFGGVGLNTVVNVQHRPVTGMRGSTAAGARAGPGRQIQDRNYFIGELTSLCTALEEETSRVVAETASQKEEQASYGALEKRYEAASAETRELQGQLADLNLLLDRSRAGRETSDIFDEVAQLKGSNGAQRQRADAAVTERQEVEREIYQIEQQLQRHAAALGERMSELPPDRQELFARLQEEKRALSDEIPKRQALLAELDQRHAEVEAAVSRDPARAEFARVKEQTAEQSRKVEALEAKAEEPILSVDDQRDALLAQVKRQNAEIAEMEREAVAAAETTKAHKAQLAAVTAELAKVGSAPSPGAAAATTEAKLEQLHAKDAEMQELIDNFDSLMATETERLDELKLAIPSILAAIASQMEASKAIESENVSAEQVAELKSELEFKTGQKEAAEQTMERLAGERTRRMNELEKIKSLDEKIAVELEQLTTKMHNMQSELASLKDIGKLRADNQARKEELTVRRDSLRARQDATRRAGQRHQAEYDQDKASVADDENASSLEALEQKLRHYESTVFLLQEYIASKGRESDFDTLKADCMSVLTSINMRTVNIARVR
eukprot:CAMPEP_0206015292 /NCGR_PEP_ID=MMETSP1464-20131121/19882_1 /ASSEMBLY_ACC=CAM_ASM_001124 /TAXON_ID=119497 /ORGANISM="Exanthemachrysis gayraliae, Strain RCC1523" /LENGTH=604 /DNA_ID=CAMNT_0053389085 /DNA_START=30 /DNA_END=1844 /DNA_ORIENTATION=+